MRAIIICNGTILNYDYLVRYIEEKDFIICADGGARHAIKLNITPDLILGDFDSIEEEWYTYFKNKNVSMKRYPVEKDEIDSEIALLEVAKLGMQEVIFLGATGTRMDHSLANIHLLKQSIDFGIKARIIDDHNEIYLTDNKLEIKGDVGQTISLIPFSEKVNGIVATDLYYPVNGLSMTLGHPFGVSNKMLKSKTLISIEQGLLLVMKHIT